MGSERVFKTVFTEDMKKDYTILIPDMLPIHFKLIIKIYEKYGYHMELLQNNSRNVIDEGLKNTHNDACYPALLVIGQFMDALKSGKYDVNKTALLMSQTGGGCRASNYIHLIRKAVASQFPQVPVISLNFSGLEKNPAFPMTPAIALRLVYAVMYGDMLMLLYNQCKPYELKPNITDQLLARWQHRLGRLMDTNDYLSPKPIYKAMLKRICSDTPFKGKEAKGRYSR